ncbi:zinc-binding alcohol dehydrogenase family protein [Chitinophaga sp. 212800010-3]|uniref:zinc-binding alcohol dehydrogenase family protein n=1 Tax=unclassified Chitinophaga TaxID=2619133 RepID=UPI002DEF01AE|nr:hypothetical protein [Chitinophaga sp. 212800010-3]
MRSLVICPNDFHLSYDSCIASGSTELHGQPIHFALIERPEPAFDPHKQTDHVLVQKKAFSCNYRDIAYMILAQQKINEAGKEIKFRPIGSEFCGVVVETGNDVTHLKKGDRVIPNAFYPSPHPKVAAGVATNCASNEYEIFHAEKLVSIPNVMQDEIGAAFTIGAQTAYAMIDRLQINENGRILITGVNSSTSLFVLNMLHGLGFRNISGICRNDQFIPRLRALGLNNIFLIPAQSKDSLIDIPAIREDIIRHGRFDYVIDPFADSNLLKCLSVMAMNGKYIYCGISDQVKFSEQIINSSHFQHILTANISIIGNCLGSSEHLEKSIKLFEQQKLPVLLDEVIENDIARFFERSFVARDKFGKVVFKYR